VAIRRWPEPLKPFPDAEVRLDADDVLWVRSPYRALGYVGVGHAEAVDAVTGPAGVMRAAVAPAKASHARAGRIAAEPASPLRIDADGFATVGDVARAAASGPEDGLVILGRGDAAVTVGGATVLAEDVEAALCSIPGVVAAAAVGMPHPRLGQIVAAVLELDGAASLASIRAAARAVLSGPSLPRKYVMVERLPRTAAGKIARAAARSLLGA
jgi:acyl-CoA synthetase (AMP-forming)/AMP-acid ligase II